MSLRLEQPRIVDKRKTISGTTEYLISTTQEWVLSSTSRLINPELVELYEWLLNSGYREGTSVFATTYKSHVTSIKSTRKRQQSSSTSSIATTSYPATEITAETSISTSNTNKNANDCNDDTLVKKETPESAGISRNNDAPKIKDEPQEEDGHGRIKKQRLDGSFVEDKLDQLSISQPHSERIVPIKTESSSLNEFTTILEDAGIKSRDEEKQLLKEFNRNTEQMIEVYFKEGMDASGVEMFDTLLGPYRRPTKEFIASFFYAVVLSPLTEPATIEAAIHVLDRTFTLHGPEPFQDIWDVQKRRREFADGTSPFSRQFFPTSSGSGSEIESNIRACINEGSSGDTTFSKLSTTPVFTGRLPSWNNIWDLIRAEFGLDTKPESRQHIALQEHQIRTRLQGDTTIQGVGEDDGVGDEIQGIREEREVRDEIGRAIVGFLLRVLEQDAVLKNVSAETFFCRNVLMLDPFSPAQTVRQALDVIFQIISLAMSSRYLELPVYPAPAPAVTTGSRAGGSWPLNIRCTLNSSGMEILQLGQQLLLLLIRFTEGGVLLPGKGLEELAREVLSRLSKMNKDRKLLSHGSKVSTGSSSSRPSTATSTAMPFTLERYSLDQTEIFLKALIQGPCLLDSGTGSGAGVKMKREKKNALASLILDNISPGAEEGGMDISFNFDEADDYNTIFKSQTGICMGSSAFVMVLVDFWFRSKTIYSGGGSAMSGGGAQLSFRRVIEEYAMPIRVRPAGTSSSNTSIGLTSSNKTEKGKKAGTRSSVRRRKASLISEEEEAELLLASIISPTMDTEPEGHEQWNAKDLEQIEWTVMMIEVLVESWIEARGIRRDEIEGTGLEQVLYPNEPRESQRLTRDQEKSISGWVAMSNLLDKIGGTLKIRWGLLENIIEAAIMVEELCLR
ncbi:hypothetical protein BX616_001887 [Lobosporangium transversale]|uniref:Uncharacterized protein n=1 Tax=Lobosporangium transversale TaxID=64571 RepID=A0A1Y2G8G4_9FUNG|nr:hypothetical protein BCR41DRAFT_390056 [Lobosporangium transversale]KAF9902580.1 hypothetical protein BX616_001887 [Lobosporangium transversale]ORZ04184.1 hypothetical protein BCR41DRAFT_390056 [Lobosporangium transversale]|eukprot:XP_021876398.1 hypothetical protein BCR41DRAFT_390056 [Lobosporangium transversale]